MSTSVQTYKKRSSYKKRSIIYLCICMSIIYSMCIIYLVASNAIITHPRSPMCNLLPVYILSFMGYDCYYFSGLSLHCLLQQSLWPLRSICLAAFYSTGHRSSVNQAYFNVGRHKTNYLMSVKNLVDFFIDSCSLWTVALSPFSLRFNCKRLFCELEQL